MDNNWHSLNINDIYYILNSNENGLSNHLINDRKAKYGCNVLPKEKKDNLIKIFFLQFVSPIVLVMIFTACISLFVGEIVDFIVILIIIITDAIFGAVQEWHAGKEANSLQNLIKVKVKVLRDGKEKMIVSDNLVVGDIVLLESGNKVSGDLRIISSNNLSVDESILTGESVSCNKKDDILPIGTNIYERTNMVYGGTSILSGRAKCIVVETGVNTEIGKISNKVLQTKNEKSPLVIRVDKLSKQIIFIILFISIFLILLMVLKGKNLYEVFSSIVALAVSAMPEGLPLALTLALTIGSNRMAKKNVIVKKLNFVESLGSCTVIASDKTGTLTVNEQTAKKILLPDNSLFDVEGSGYNDNGKVIEIDKANISDAINIAKLGVINNEAFLKKENDKWINGGDSIDVAFLCLGEKLNIGDNFNKIKNIPYESEKKYSGVFYEENDNYYCTIKGSIEVILSFCDSMIVNGKKVKLDAEHIKVQNQYLASEGYRVIAIAKSSKLDSIPNKKEISDKDIPNLSFVGLVGFIDPIRKETIDSIKKCKDAGIKVVMITGDHPLTAYSIVKELYLASDFDEVCTGNDIEDYLKKGEKEFDKFVKSKKIFTRVTPLEKLEIVNSYKRQGEYVAVTGDGVNDAPAIKSANIGIAMGSGTDVAKDTGKMIIMDDNFMSIVTGIEEGRNAYSNIRKVIYFLLSCGLSELFFFTMSILFDLPMPLLAIQLLWLNIVTDGFQDMALSFEQEGKEIMKEMPRKPKENIFDKQMIQQVLISGLTIGIIVFTLWYVLTKMTDIPINTARSFVMMLMVFMQNFHVLNCRSEKKSAFKVPLSKNYYVVFSIIFAIVLQVIVQQVPVTCEILKIGPLSFMEIVYVFIISIPILIVMELFKKIKFR